MAIGYFHVIRVAVLPAKADPPLIIDGYGVLPGPVALQSMKPIAGWDFQIIKGGRHVNIFKATHRPSDNIRRQAL